MVKTLNDFFYELGNLSYDRGDSRVTKNNIREKEVKNFVQYFVPGAEVLSNGKDGKPVVLRGVAEQDMGTDGATEIDFHGFQLYDYADSDGKWMIVTFDTKEALEQHLTGEAGYLNAYSSQMFVFEDGVERPFEMMFNGDNDAVIGIDKDQFDTPLDIAALQGRIWVRWMDPKELDPLTDAEVAAYLAAKEN